VLGKSPFAFFQDMRVEHAIHLLRTTASSIERVAQAVGYTDATTLTSLLKRRTGLGPRDLRSRREGRLIS
jgi:transcriptional regulator GlxA family with amidase domain